jgi:hypothetical protein
MTALITPDILPAAWVLGALLLVMTGAVIVVIRSDKNDLKKGG